MEEERTQLSSTILVSKDPSESINILNSRILESKALNNEIGSFLFDYIALNQHYASRLMKLMESKGKNINSNVHKYIIKESAVNPQFKGNLFLKDKNLNDKNPNNSENNENGSEYENENENKNDDNNNNSNLPDHLGNFKSIWDSILYEINSEIDSNKNLIKNLNRIIIKPLKNSFNPTKNNYYHDILSQLNKIKHNSVTRNDLNYFNENSLIFFENFEKFEYNRLIFLKDLLLQLQSNLNDKYTLNLKNNEKIFENLVSFNPDDEIKRFSLNPIGEQNDSKNDIIPNINNQSDSPINTTTNNNNNNNNIFNNNVNNSTNDINKEHPHRKLHSLIHHSSNNYNTSPIANTTPNSNPMTSSSFERSSNDNHILITNSPSKDKKHKLRSRVGSIFNRSKSKKFINNNQNNNFSTQAKSKFSSDFEPLPEVQSTHSSAIVLSKRVNNNTNNTNGNNNIDAYDNLKEVSKSSLDLPESKVPSSNPALNTNKENNKSITPALIPSKPKLNDRNFSFSSSPSSPDDDFATSSIPLPFHPSQPPPPPPPQSQSQSQSQSSQPLVSKNSNSDLPDPRNSKPFQSLTDSSLARPSSSNYPSSIDENLKSASSVTLPNKNNTRNDKNNSSESDIFNDTNKTSGPPLIQVQVQPPPPPPVRRSYLHSESGNQSINQSSNSNSTPSSPVNNPVSSRNIVTESDNVNGNDKHNDNDDLPTDLPKLTPKVPSTRRKDIVSKLFTNLTEADLDTQGKSSFDTSSINNAKSLSTPQSQKLTTRSSNTFGSLTPNRKYFDNNDSISLVSQQRTDSRATSLKADLTGNLLNNGFTHPDLSVPGLNASILEVFSATFKNGVLESSKTIGQIAFTYIREPLNQLPSNSLLKLKLDPKIQKIVPNAVFLRPINTSNNLQDDDSNHNYLYNLNTLQVSSRIVGGLKYMLLNQESPIILTPIWRFESHQASCMLTIKLSHKIVSKLDDTTSIILNDFGVSLSIEGTETTSAFSKPQGSFNKDKKRITWKYKEPLTLSRTHQQERIIARFMTEGMARESSSGCQAKFLIDSNESTSLCCADNNLFYQNIDDDIFGQNSDNDPETWKVVNTAKTFISGSFIFG
ncbi:Syp1p ASCRUDRAFT_76504 [Ascoidea rubescens DSM 1968]|uniref:MHD domain-containing protein n=1 Tax=Ascoidea rubescens DSM 1968 TaxID=1344418 RepID=A0A1D2VG22_9ASCO|nr:hypothetical protein ASCRUDRAFT_76504 [Ascoidea rubescens DSM 1968]ODV60539.1 hypothetical protein ASCRUDRAFT_76504 [Ascoidea rubescens DSM 1968]